MPIRDGGRGPLRFLILSVAVDLAVAAVLRIKNALALFSGKTSWDHVLGTVACVYLFVVVYALVRVIRVHESLVLQVLGGDERISAIAETSADWLRESTPDFVLTYSSPRLSTILGYATEDVVGRNLTEFMARPDAEQAQRLLAAGDLADGWRDARSQWQTADGGQVILQTSGVALRDGTGRVVGYRGSCHPADPAREQAARLDELRRQISAVLSAGSLRMALQPIIDIATGRITGAEALARFPDERPPNLWFEEAGAVGLRFELELLAIASAAARLAELPDASTLSVNASPEVIADPRFAAHIRSMNLPTTRLVIEVTEHARIDEYDVLVAGLRGLRSAGVRVAVDDAGAGYASLTHVLNIRPDIVKVDRSLVANVNVDQARRTLITSLTLLALDIGATVTAEGVETAAELETLATLGVDHAQGYLIARPALDITAWPHNTAARSGLGGMSPGGRV